ncbi:MAG: winged helix DNA-binding domain-containing protein [Paraglaciecola sp.]|uniref:winged helix-turn-helix domain-containing protein n=1 Tax=Paraglaciecola sp. TaxID=1920173 RepID=UPI00273E25C3|nr:crosslink repair DNA glycosylase YcaQ family protein [Paraglaciecola sp.]MDP5030421.1 winged helix DNA-binding domain-containing protein [Paraglaciecola sp.]MDP5131852.1 winged helix DNA-binding domain-containing protein [Paraglaciecola sp.]
MAEQLSQNEARKLVLVSQGLHKTNPFGTGENGILRSLQQLSYIQIDTISVVERAHHHSLWNRVNNYSADKLAKLIEDKQVFEYWSHAAAYLPMCDYRYSLQRKHAIAGGETHWHSKDKKLTQQILQRIRTEGPLQAKDFEREGGAKAAGWWDWKPAKKALEQLFMEGELMAVKRQGFQKVYDLTERVLPLGIDTSVPSDKEFYRYLITRCLQANGLATASEMAYLRKGIKRCVETQCVQMLENGELQVLECQGQRYYALPQAQESLKKSLKRSHVKILSPFDNLLIQRKRMQQLFDFDYQIECYVPEPKRQYGYFSLPLLWGNGFSGRMDAKIERKTGLLLIQHLHIETAKIEAFIQDFLPALREFLLFNQGTKIEVKRLSAKYDLSEQNIKAYRQTIENLCL